VAGALVASLLAWFAFDRIWGWQEYSGLTYSEAGVRLEHPRSWTPTPHNGQFAVLAPSDLTSLFTPGSEWDSARRLADSDPDQLVGVYVETGRWYSSKGLTPLDEQVKNKFVGLKVEATMRQPTGAPEDSAGVVGTMTAPDGKPPTLYFELIALESSSKRGVLMLFCPEDDKEEQAGTFKRVLESAQLP
jgi:hypothetical protein